MSLHTRSDDLVPLSPGGARIIALGVVLIFLTTLWTAMRLYCRHLKRVPMQPEDWLHIAALFFHYGQISGSFVSVALGGAGHMSKELGKTQLLRFSKTSIARQFLYASSTLCSKLSICVLLIRIFANRKLKIASICIMVLSGLWFVLTICVCFLVCRPVEKNWNSSVPGTCDTSGTGYMVVAVVNIFNELCLLFLPLPMVLRLQVSRRYRIGIAAIFSSGVLTITTAVLRVPFLLSTDFTNITHDTKSQLLAFSEPAVAIIASCSPLLKPLLDRALGPLKHKKDSSGTPSGNSQFVADHTIGGSDRTKRKGIETDPSEPRVSEDQMELAIMGASQGVQNAQVVGHARRSSDVFELDPEQDPGGSGIRVMRETIVTRGDYL